MENEMDILQELWGEEFFAEAATGMQDEGDPSPSLDEYLEDFCPLPDDAEDDQILGALEQVIRRDGCIRDRRAA